MSRLATNSDGAESKMNHARVGVTGCAGRVGKLLAQELSAGTWPGLSLMGGSVRPGADKPAGYDYFVTDNPDELFAASDIVIDFTTPESTARHIWIAAKHHKPLIIGSTGLNADQEREIHDAALECPIVYAANMSVGVTLLQALIEQAAARLGPAWDIEVNETHHRNKVDSPSGTALALGRAAQKGRGAGDFVYDRAGKRKSGDIGFSVQRGGDVVGEHTVSFFGEGERVALTHIATDRALFARGALRAAQWVRNKPYGLYSMRDVLGI